jgi:hypothetical protein
MINEAAIEDAQLSFADIDIGWSAAMQALLSEDEPSRNQSLDKGKKRQVSPFTADPETYACDFYERRIAALEDFFKGYNGDRRIVTDIAEHVYQMRWGELEHCKRELKHLQGVR